MKITAIETLQIAERPNFVWLQIHTDAGLIGLGETQRDPDAVASYIHATVAPYLIGRDPADIERHSRHLTSCYLGHGAASAEIRAASAVDIALWDLLGQAAGLPVHGMLGGLARDSIAVYNTCAGPNYNRLYDRRVVRAGEKAVAHSPLDDQAAFMLSADELAHSLIEEGMAGMKIWPFDPWALENNGAFISAEGLRIGLEPFEKIRRAVGDRIEIMAELHSLWQVPAARRIAHALEGVDAFWVEDPVQKMDNVPAVAEIAAATRLPVVGGESLAGRPVFRDLLVAGALGVVIVDLGWCGGFSEARKIAALADTFAKPIAPHDCSGPVVFTASVHLSLHAPNAIFQEMVRAFLRGWYQNVLTDLPRVERGRVFPMTGPGLGTRLQPEFLRRGDLSIRRADAR
jgi:L-alanine-DL-glutamate epimerase-like enolase superfamily enzyme